MINAICGIKTSVCTGNCNSCVNSPLLGKTAVEEMEYSKSAYNKGYDDGQKAMAKRLLKAWYRENNALGIEQDYVLEIAYAYGVEVEE